MAEPAAPPPPSPDEAASPLDPAIVGQLQAAGNQEYQAAVARGGALGEHRAAMESEPPPPTPAEAAYSPPPTATAPPPPPPTPAEAAAPEGIKPSNHLKPQPAVTLPTPEEIAAANHEPNVWDFAKALVQGGVPEVTQAPARIGAQAAHTTAIGAGAVAEVVDKLWDLGTGKTRPSGETYHTGAEDAVFNFDKNYIKPAIEHWTPKAGSYIGDEGSGSVAQGLGGGAEMLTYGRLGPAGIASFMSNAFTKSATDNVDAGMDANQALVSAGLDAVGAAAQMLLVGKDFLKGAVKAVPTAMLRRVLTAMPAGDFIAMAKDQTKKWLLEASGNDKAAQQIDVLGHLTNVEEAVQNAVYGAAFPSREAPKENAPAPPKPAEAAAPEPKDVPPPPGPPPAAVAAAPKAEPAPPSTVPDQPSAEPVKQIRAQLTDMRRADTPRRGVLISPETQAHIDSLPEDHEHGAPISNQIEQARTQGRSVQTPAGELIVKTKGDAAKATAQLKAGTDPQLVIGRLTGAGDGKDPSQTVVVQGREVSDGSVTTERMVRPEDQGMATQAMLDQGKVPVITTPEGVIAERHVAVLDEKKAAEPTKTPVEANPAPRPETAPQEIAAPALSGEAEKPQEGFYKTESGKEVPVHLAGEPVGGKIKVHPLNEEGEPQPPVEVPAERVRTGAAPAEPAAKEVATNEQATKGTALDQLPATLAAHERQEQAPAGRKNPTSLQERQDNASAFANVLGAAAKEAAEKGSAAEPTIRRAAEAASRARGLTNKSEEATRKGQGTSHAIVSTRVREMHRAARELLGKTKPGEEPAEINEKKPVKPVEPPKPKERSAPKVVAEKAAAAGAKDTARFHALTERYLKAKTPEDATAARDELEQHVRAVVEKLNKPPEEAEAILRHLSDLRAESGRREPPKMSDTLEEEEHQFERPQEGFQTVRRMAEMSKEANLKWHEATTRTKNAMEHLGVRMAQAGVIRRLRLLTDTGMPMSYHELLQHMFSHASHDADLQARIGALLKRAPDVPVFFRSEILAPNTLRKVNAAGLFHAGARSTAEGQVFAPSLQVKMRDNMKAFSFVHTVLHEGEHAATLYQMHLHQGIASELADARDILERRLRSKYGDAAIDKLIAFHGENLHASSDVDVPEEVQHLYGLTDPAEMVAELHTNPKFLEEVIRSEEFASPSEKLPRVAGIPGLLHKIISAVAKLMGYNDPKLALHILDASLRAAEGQRNNVALKPLYGEGAFSRLAAAQPSARLKAFAEAPPSEMRAMADAEEEKGALLEEPKPVKAEGALRSLVSSEAVDAARANVHAVTSRAIDMGRNAITALKTQGQIFRDNRGYFGHEDDPSNPMNELREVSDEKNKLLHAMRQVSNPVAKAWMRLSTKDNLDVGGLLRDATLWKIDPRESPPKQNEKGFDAKTFARAQEYVHRYDRLSPDARAVFDGVLKANKTLRGMERRAAVDAAIEGFGVDLSDGQRQLLYGAKDAGAFDRLIKEGGLVDVGDKNEKLRAALRDWVGSEIQGPYAHLGRPGDYVVQATPEGTKEFDTQIEAEKFARQVRDTSPGSKGVAEERGGKWVVDYKVQHVSMHRTRAEAETARAELVKQGFDTETVTHKVYTREQAGQLSTGMRELMTESMRRIGRGGQDEGTDALMDSLHSAYLQMQAQRSAYAGSQLMRKGFGGVKAKDMRQNFAEHAASSIWHAAQVRTVFRQAAAMARLREMAKTTDDQALAYKRSETVQALNNHAALEARVNSGGAFNRKAAQLGFLTYLTSPAHAAIWMTQNFSTGIPWAGARYGYAKTAASFARAMGAVGAPAMRRAANEQFSKWASPDDIHEAVVRAIEKHPTMGKWAAQIRELYARGVISHGYANELGQLAQGAHPAGVRMMDWARVAPAMADAFNRTSTALAGLELTGGDLRKTADMVEAIHANYSAQNKPLAFKALSRIPGGTSLTMFKTYAQEMAHMVYSNLYHATVGADFKSEEGRARAWVGAKTVAGLMVGNAMFAGVYGAVGLEPLRLLLYAYHKLFDEEGEVWDMKNAIHHFLVEHLGAAAGNAAARGPIADALGVDVQDRMGLANLFFHNPPDLLTSDKDTWKTWISDEAGPLVQLVANSVTGAAGHLQNGEYLQAVLSVLPVKVVQDSLKAMQLLETGKQTGTGAHITQPSALDAAKQAFGLKPASVADAQEQRGVKTEYTKVQGMVRASIIRQLLTAKPDSSEHQAAIERLQRYNERNPGAGITRREINEEARRNYRATQNLPSRNQRANEAADFSGRP